MVIPASTGLVIEIAIEKIGNSAHRNVKILDIILALNLFHFISMEFECMRLEIFEIEWNDIFIWATRR